MNIQYVQGIAKTVAYNLFHIKWASQSRRETVYCCASRIETSFKVNLEVCANLYSYVVFVFIYVALYMQRCDILCLCCDKI